MPEIKIHREEILDWRKKQFVDKILPTLTIQRAAQIRGAGITVTAGSHRVAPGSTYLMTYLSVQSGSSEFWYAITKTGTLAPGQVNGTVDVGYFQAKGVDTKLGGVQDPVHAFGPGTILVRFLTPGSARNYGLAFEGLEL